MSQDADAASISRATTKLLSAVNASDVAGVLAVWGEDGVLMPPHHPSVHGRAQIERYFRQLFELHLRSWGLPIHLTSAPSGFEALL